MIADYFTKPLQGVLFHKLRPMIMGHVNIALPSDQPTVQPDGIPPIVKCEESRSVLEEEKVAGSSLFSLTVLPAHRRIIKLPGGGDVECLSKQVKSKKASLSWVDIASKERVWSWLFWWNFKLTERLFGTCFDSVLDRLDIAKSGH